jgi:hypothetical protein
METNTFKILISLLIALLSNHYSAQAQKDPLSKAFLKGPGQEKALIQNAPIIHSTALPKEVYNPFVQDKIKSSQEMMALDSIDHFEMKYGTEYFSYDTKGRTTSINQGYCLHHTWVYNDEALSYITTKYENCDTTLQEYYKFNIDGKLIEYKNLITNELTHYFYDALSNITGTSFWDADGFLSKKTSYSYQNGSTLTKYSAYSKNPGDLEWTLDALQTLTYTPDNKPIKTLYLSRQQGSLDTLYIEEWEYLPFTSSQKDSMVTYVHTDENEAWHPVQKQVNLYDIDGNHLESHEMYYNISSTGLNCVEHNIMLYDTNHLLSIEHDSLYGNEWKTYYSYDSLLRLKEYTRYKFIGTIWDISNQMNYNYIESPKFTEFTKYYYYDNGEPYITYEQKLNSGEAYARFYIPGDLSESVYYNISYPNENVILPIGYAPGYLFGHGEYMVTRVTSTITQGYSTLWREFYYYYSPISLAGIGETEEHPMLKAYPNPASTMLTVETSEETTATLELFNSHGQMVGSFPIMQKATIPVQQLAKGIYFFRMVNNGISLGASKFVKE